MLGVLCPPLPLAPPRNLRCFPPLLPTPSCTQSESVFPLCRCSTSLSPKSCDCHPAAVPLPNNASTFHRIDQTIRGAATPFPAEDSQSKEAYRHQALALHGTQQKRENDAQHASDPTLFSTTAPQPAPRHQPFQGRGRPFFRGRRPFQRGRPFQKCRTQGPSSPPKQGRQISPLEGDEPMECDTQQPLGAEAFPRTARQPREEQQSPERKRGFGTKKRTRPYRGGLVFMMDLRPSGDHGCKEQDTQHLPEEAAFSTADSLFVCSLLNVQLTS